jgi:DNA-directed RNA polymerase subunit F
LPKEVLEEKSVTLAEVQEILKENEKRGELSYIQRVTLDYATKFSQLPVDVARKLVNDLHNEFSLDLDTAIQIVNCVPASLGELRSLVAGAKEGSPSQEKLKEILETVKKATSH